MHSSRIDMANIINITMPLCNGMPFYPGDPPVSIKPHRSIKNGDAANVNCLNFCTHSGTHFDAPYHFFAAGKKTDQYEADFFMGRARVIDLSSCGDIRREDISGRGIKPDDIVLFKTRNSEHLSDAEYYFDHVSVLHCAAQYLVSKRIRALGFDYFSIEKDSLFPAHRELLGAGIPIIEGLRLTGAHDGVYKMTAMFLNITGGDGAPLTAFLEKY